MVNGEQGSNIITKETIDRILDQYISDLFRNLYYKVYHEMTEKERQFVQAVVKISRPKVKAQEIGREMDKKPGYIFLSTEMMTKLLCQQAMAMCSLCCRILTALLKNK